MIVKSARARTHLMVFIPFLRRFGRFGVASGGWVWPRATSDEQARWRGASTPMVANQVGAAQSGGALSLLTKWPDAEMPFAQAFADDVAFGTKRTFRDHPSCREGRQDKLAYRSQQRRF